jgi:hypothetical protein
MRGEAETFKLHLLERRGIRDVMAQACQSAPAVTASAGSAAAEMDLHVSISIYVRHYGIDVQEMWKSLYRKIPVLPK